MRAPSHWSLARGLVAGIFIAACAKEGTHPGTVPGATAAVVTPASSAAGRVPCTPLEREGDAGCVAQLRPDAVAHLEAASTTLSGAADALAALGPVESAHDLLGKISATSRWKKARHLAWGPRDPVVDLEVGMAALRKRAPLFAAAAAELRSLAASVAAAERGDLGSPPVSPATISARVVQAVEPIPGASSEGYVAFQAAQEAYLDVRGYCEANPAEPLCARREELDAARAYLDAVRTPWAVMAAASHDIVASLGPLLDEHAIATLHRRSGEGPRPGQPCEPEDVCADGNACVRADGGARICSDVDLFGVMWRTNGCGAMEGPASRPCPRK
jgi:hypothetical protein